MFLYTTPTTVQSKINDKISVKDFEAAYPQYAFNFGSQLKLQPRIYCIDELATLPTELVPVEKRRRSTKGNPNHNQTKTHSQCAGCNRVLRNDRFSLSPSLQEQNIVHSYCLDCARTKGQDYYGTRAINIANRRIIVWRYLAPRCAVCGFDKSIHALDMHHVSDKNYQIASLITWVCNPDTILFSSIERLCAEAERCIPLCSNCHRMVHSGEVVLAGVEPLRYDPVALVGLLRDYDRPFQYSLMELAA